MPDVEAHITGTVWKIECEVGQEIEEGDTVAILESMKMEMPVEAEDDGKVKEIKCAGGPVGERGRRAGRARVVARPSSPRASSCRTSRPKGSSGCGSHNEQRRGALDHEILDTLAETVGGLDARCLVLTGTGPVFSAGYDLGNLEGREFEENAEKLVAHPFHAAIEALEAFPFPVIGALNGHAIGGGLELALTCDIRIAASGIKLGMPPAKLGLVYSHTGLRKFLDVVGPAHTAELFFVGPQRRRRPRRGDRACEPRGRARRAGGRGRRPGRARSPPTRRSR